MKALAIGMTAIGIGVTAVGIGVAAVGWRKVVCAPCSLLLKSAIQHEQRGDWERCHDAAVKARGTLENGCTGNSSWHR